MANPKPDTRGLKPAQKGEPSRNPSGISKEKARLRELYETILSEIEDSSEVNPDKLTNFERVIREELRLALTAPSDKLRAEACARIRTQVLGKDFYVMGKPEDIKIEIITTKANDDDDKD